MNPISVGYWTIVLVLAAGLGYHVEGLPGLIGTLLGYGALSAAISLRWMAEMED